MHSGRRARGAKSGVEFHKLIRMQHRAAIEYYKVFQAEDRARSFLTSLSTDQLVATVIAIPLRVFDGEPNGHTSFTHRSQAMESLG